MLTDCFFKSSQNFIYLYLDLVQICIDFIFFQTKMANQDEREKNEVRRKRNSS